MLPILLFTGLSGAGKTTLSAALATLLKTEGFAVALIDGDYYRNTLNKDLGFSEADRRENIRRLVQVAIQKQQEGYISLMAAINPYEDQRRELSRDTGALIIYVHCPLPVLMARDTKGLYRRANLPDEHPDKLHNLSGVNDRYDIPEHFNVAINTAEETVESAAGRLLKFVLGHINT